MAHLVFDLGGTWLKAAAFAPNELETLRASPALLTERQQRHPSPRASDTFAPAMLALARAVADGIPIQAAVVSTAGIVHPSGRHLVACADHLAFLRDSGWIAALEEALAAPVRLINDAEAFLLGAAETGLVPRVGTLCALAVGTGLGCAISRDARHWRPQGKPSLLGSIRCGGDATYDSLASASRLAALDPENNLVRVLVDPAFAAAREGYFATLADLFATATILHDADEILVGGGLADAAREAGLDLAAEVRRHWTAPPPETGRWPRLRAAPCGNALALLGAAAMAESIHVSEESPAFDNLATEQVHPSTDALHRESTRQLINRLWRAEADAATDLAHSLDSLASLADHIISQWNNGGRILYVGAGTSGRLAALDAVEIPCTFGHSPDRVVAVVAGGLNDCALRIESEGEEDFSSASDLILLQPGPKDTVIGISASGSAAFVQSALAVARQRGASTALITASPSISPWDWTIPLASGVELVAGSTRMKAGTATKKVLNFLTTTVMARTGKLRGPHMIDLACLNAKAVRRAIRILKNLFSLSDVEANDLLVRHDYHLHRAIEAAEHSEGTK